MMMKPVLFCICLSAFFLEINCQCYTIVIDNLEGSKPTHCKYEDLTFELGETKRIKCTDATCDAETGNIKLCNVIAHYTQIPDYCKVITDYEQCKENLVMKEDETKECIYKPDDEIIMVLR